MREKILWNDSWLFCLDDQENMSQTDYDDKNWTRVGLPHDWSILMPLSETMPSGAGGGYAVCGTGWYRKHFDMNSVNHDPPSNFSIEAAVTITMCPNALPV